MSATEIAVYLGHRKIWKAICDQQHEVALILEDDAAIIDHADFETALQNAHDTRTWDILNFFDYKPKPIKYVQEWCGLTIVDYKYPASGCVAYLITKDAATKLLERKSIYRPVDEDLSWCWEFGLRVRSVSPNVCAEQSDRLGGSLIEQDRAAARFKTPLVRRFIGLVQAAVKQVCARRHLAKIIAAERSGSS